MLKMKPAGAAVLLLLCSALVVASADTLTHLSCLPDIEPVLKEMGEMRALMSEQGKAMEAMETRLTASERTVEEQRVELRSAKAQLEELKEKNGAQAASLSQALSQVAALKEREGLKVAFSAGLQSPGTLGPYSTEIALPFKHLYSNIGNAFNAQAGTFTAPVKGVYHFTLFAWGYGHPSMRTIVNVYKNGEFVFSAYGMQSAGGVNPGNAASLLLEAGDTVSARLRRGARVHDDADRVTTFSGHLLFPM